MIIKKGKIKKIFALSSQAFGQYKRQIIILAVLGFISGILEGIGVNALIPLFSFAIGNNNVAEDVISKKIAEVFAALNIDFSVEYLLVLIISLFILKAITFTIVSYIKAVIIADYEEKTRSVLLDKVFKAKWPYLLNQRLGHLENVLMTDVRSSATFLDQISTMIILLINLLIYMVVAINISLNITLITLTIGFILFGLFKPLFFHSKKFSQKTESTNKEIAHHINENVLGIKTVKSMVAGEETVAKGRIYFRALREYGIKLSLFKTITGAIVQPIGLILVCLIFLFSYKNPSFNLAALIAIIYLIQKIFTYLQQLEKSFHVIGERLPYLESVIKYQNEVEENVEDNTGSGSFIFDHRLEFRNVIFSYNNSKRVLDSITFSISRGEMVGIIGPSGVGKTTLVDLILRLFNPNSGEILLDDKDISTIDLYEWRENVGYVSQDMFLVNDTIANNIRFYSDSVSDEQVKSVAKMANIYDFTETLPDKFETIIGERGILLSAGQRQRVVIARVLARNPKLLILDEATSALDNESELQIQQIIKDLKGKVTVLAIAHRLSTIKDSDRLIVLKDGKIVEEGDPDDLLKDKESYFYKVYNIRE
ncbi:ABC transporter ATP-binding protein [Candidatus Falkowbacteria bacterium]|nr:ABC transporter ATP-binding protein [Candidatus Falkowbacteria bacterium]